MAKRLTTLFLMLLAAALLTACSSDDTNPGPAGPDPVTGSGTVSGLVTDTHHALMNMTSVSVDGVTVTTDENGAFTVADVAAGIHQLTVTRDGWAPNHRMVEVIDGEMAHLPRIVLMPDHRVTLDAQTGGRAETGDQRGSVTFPADAFVGADGTAYTGTVTVALCAAHPEDAFFDGVFPGDYEGLREDGSTAAVQSFGFMDVRLFGAAGEALQLADGATATMTLDLDPGRAATAPATIPMWHYDDTTAQWVEEGAATLSGTIYTGTVSHFTSWNYDRVPSGDQLCWVTGTVRDNSGNPVPRAYVRAIATGQGYAHRVWTDDNGRFAVRGLKDGWVEFWATKGSLVTELQSATLSGDCPYQLDLTMGVFVPVFTAHLEWEDPQAVLVTEFYIPFVWDDGEDPDYDWYHLGVMDQGLLGTVPYAMVSGGGFSPTQQDTLVGAAFTPGTSEYWVSNGWNTEPQAVADALPVVQLNMGGGPQVFDAADASMAGAVSGDWWHVFDLEVAPNGDVTVVPVMRFETPRGVDGVFPDSVSEM